MANEKISWFKIIGFLILGIVIFGLGIMAANLPALKNVVGGEGTAPALGTLTIFPPWGAGLTISERIIGTLGLIIGVGADGGQEVDMSVFIVGLAIFLIILVALSDIIAMFSTFKPWIAWTIGLGLAVVSGVTGIIYALTAIFGLTSGIGAIGIAIIIISAVAAAVVINLGFGDAAQQWALKRQIGISAAKASKGFAKVKSAAKGLRDLADEMEKEN